MERNTAHQVTVRLWLSLPDGVNPAEWDWNTRLRVDGLAGAEVMDHVEVPPRQCANEACGRWFTLQEGRAEKGQRRKTGVLYCSAKCARAQTQRNYRERKKATA